MLYVVRGDSQESPERSGEVHSSGALFFYPNRSRPARASRFHERNKTYVILLRSVRAKKSALPASPIATK